jgi:uncharacterized protein YdaU (DUF1376 family)
VNYFEHHIGDYEQATSHLTACEDGIYGRLIRWYMASETPIPPDLKAVQRRVRARSRDEVKAVETVLAEFFELRTDGWHQHRCDEEIARFKDKQAKAKRSADARWNAHRSDSDGNANASQAADAVDMRTHSEGNAPRARPQTPDTKHQSSDVEHPQVKPASRSKTLGVDDLIAEGVDPSLARDWVAVRKAKKAVLTPTAWEAVKREAEVAGLTPAEAVKIAAESGWQGFKASWLQRDQGRNGGHDDIFAGAR